MSVDGSDQTNLTNHPADDYSPSWSPMLARPNPWDLNQDSIVNILDLVQVASQFGLSGEDLEGDVNGDGTVNIFDLVEVAQHFGETSPPAFTANRKPD